MSNTAAPHDDPLPDDEILYHLVGITTAELDPDHPADLMLQAVTKRYVRARDDVTHYAMRIANEMRRVGEQHPTDSPTPHPAYGRNNPARPHMSTVD